VLLDKTTYALLSAPALTPLHEVNAVGAVHSPFKYNFRVKETLLNCLLDSEFSFFHAKTTGLPANRFQFLKARAP
jgi:hypothetical protein